MTKIKSAVSRFMKDESGQGATEYILLLVVVVGLVVFFGPKVKEMIERKTAEVGGNVEGFQM